MRHDTSRPPYPFLLVLAAALLLAVLHMPYGYYQLLKLVAAAIGVWSAWAAWNDGRRVLAGVWGIFALAYNPLIPLHLVRETWAVINVASAAFVIWAAWRTGRPAP